MAKIDRKELSRGVGLTVEHFKQPIEDAQDLLNDAAVAQEQMARGFGTFRVDIWTPHVGSQLIGPFPPDHKVDRPFSIPFILPPTQDFFEANISGSIPSYILSRDTPLPVLSELHLSFNQRGEGAAITDRFHNPGQNVYAANALDAGKLDFLNASKVLNLGVSIVEKTLEIWTEDTKIRAEPETEVLSYEIPADAFIGASFRANPFIVTGINRVFNPYKSYTALIYCQGLWAYGEKVFTDAAAYVLLNLNISLKFRMALLPRDIDDSPNSEVQNMPTIHRGVSNKKTESSIFPAAGTPIEAGTTDGVEVGIEVVDKRVNKRIHGGYTDVGEARKTEIQDDACYDVISASLFANLPNGGISKDSRVDGNSDPYGGTVTQMDRAIIPIYYPFVLHHVILAWNWQTWSRGYASAGVANIPVNRMPAGEYTIQLGINLGCGLRSDLFGYQNIAKAEIIDPQEGGSSTWLVNLVDRIRVHEPAGSIDPLTFGSGLLQRQWDLFAIPIVAGVINGKGLVAQGPPVWCGQSNQLTAWDSRVIGTAGRTGLLVGAAPPLKGMEQFIEVRAKMFHGIAAGPDEPKEMLVGYGGHRVYLIGKKHLAGVRRS